MYFKKKIAVISAFIVIGSTFTNGGIFAFADSDENTFVVNQLPTVVYSADNQTTVDCRYYENMPNIPYIRFSDYYKLWTDDNAEIINNCDGTYNISTPTGGEAVIDINKNTLFSESFSMLKTVKSEIDGTDVVLDIFIKETEEVYDFDEKPMLIEFDNYNIDIDGDENDLWFPVATLCDIFKGQNRSAICFDKALYFLNQLSGDISIESFISTEYTMDYFATYAETGRPQDMIDYNYNELCLNIDLKYGYPGRIQYENTLADYGLDGMLSNTNDGTRLVKSHLLSENPYAYVLGLEELTYYMNDGGHTNFHSYFECSIPQESIQEFYTNMSPYLELEFPYEGMNITDSSGAYIGYQNSFEGLLSEADEVKTFKDDDTNYISLAVKGDTAVFTFSSFEFDMDGWGEYYHNGGKMPDDLISIFHNCVTECDKNPEIKNFIVDLGGNGGGITVIEYYMMSLMADDNSITYKDVKNDFTFSSGYIIDKNLDGVFDDKDNEVKFDLNFAIITSNFSFSCANLMASEARDNGILLIGDRSGGGGCAIEIFMLPDGQLYQFSIGTKMLNKDGESIDSGIIPDISVANPIVKEEGGYEYTMIDLSNAYNFENLSDMCKAFYDGKAQLYQLGDVTGDGTIDAIDASAILTAYANESVGIASDLKEEQRSFADVNNDNIIDATDASVVLTYYSLTSSDYKGTFLEFLEEQKIA